MTICNPLGRMAQVEDSQTLGVLLRTPSEVLIEQVYARLRSAGFEDIRPTHGPVFRYIAPTGSRATDLASKAQMTKQSMAYLLEDLAKLGYIDQIPDPSDGRARLVLLTARGRQAQKAAKQANREVEESWAGKFGAADWEQFRDLLVRLNEVVRE
jgi:DNA-binding MarR family transcriptional regulator